MSMSKKDFIALADAIRQHNEVSVKDPKFTDAHLVTLAYFCREQNPAFKCGRWLAYIAGECGPSGGQIKKGKA
jgi:hypothetical protein